ncbi:MAG: cytochrome C [Planctomycetota bacterium]|nr:MAG: cytochrome C [Planctomycetota bacterium]
MFKKVFGVILFMMALAMIPISPNMKGILNTAEGGIATTKHDFSTAAWNPGGQICEPCHTPHGGNTGITDAPLWNHAVTTATFTPYSSGTLNATVGAPSGISILCLSCHDGTVALEDFGGSTGGTNFIPNTSPAYIGTDLRGSHPVSFIYNTSLATSDGGLFDPATASSGLGGTIEQDMLFGTTPGSKTLECASCHDVHDNTNGFFLIKSNAASALCLTCHNK